MWRMTLWKWLTLSRFQWPPPVGDCSKLAWAARGTQLDHVGVVVALGGHARHAAFHLCEDREEILDLVLVGRGGFAAHLGRDDDEAVAGQVAHGRHDGLAADAELLGQVHHRELLAEAVVPAGEARLQDLQDPARLARGRAEVGAVGREGGGMGQGARHAAISDECVACVARRAGILADCLRVHAGLAQP